MVARMKPSLKNPNARKALQRLTDEWNQTKSDKITPQALLKEHLLPAGIRLAAKSIDAKAKIRVRIGKDWLKDRSGKVPEIDPGHLPFPDLAQWVFQEAQRDAAETVLEHVKPESIIIDGLEDLPRDSPSILDLLILAEDRRNPPRLNRDDLLKIATTQHERMFIKLAEQGLSLKQIARRMRKTPNNVYPDKFSS